MDPQAIIRILEILHQEYAEAQPSKEDSNGGSSKQTKIWKPPSLGFYKLNTDVACFKDGSGGLGSILHDPVGMC